MEINPLVRNKSKKLKKHKGKKWQIFYPIFCYCYSFTDPSTELPSMNEKKKKKRNQENKFLGSQ